jgi:hypothetical protein
MIKKDFNAIYKSISSVSLHQFPEETLRSMYETCSYKQKELLDELKIMEVSLKKKKNGEEAGYVK